MRGIVPFTSSRPLASSLVAIAGGAALVVGARLPWMSFYAGLKPLLGTRGLHGQLLFACGVALVIAGLVLAIHPLRRIQLAVGALGGASALYAVYLLVRMQLAVRHIATHDPMMFARQGPGLFVVVAGGLIAATALAGLRARISPRSACSRRAPNRGRGRTGGASSP
jgi:hypothetical protein